jgi:hypothetical protein
MQSKMEVVRGNTGGSESQIQLSWGYDFSCAPKHLLAAVHTERPEGAAEPRPYPRMPCGGLKSKRTARGADPT